AILLYNTWMRELNSNQLIYPVPSCSVVVTSSIPFISLITALIPSARFVVGSARGWQATVVSQTIGAIPFYARLVENSLREVSEGKIEAALMMRSEEHTSELQSRFDLVCRLLLAKKTTNNVFSLILL